MVLILLAATDSPGACSPRSSPARPGHPASALTGRAARRCARPAGAAGPPAAAGRGSRWPRRPSAAGRTGRTAPARRRSAQACSHSCQTRSAGHLGSTSSRSSGPTRTTRSLAPSRLRRQPSTPCTHGQLGPQPVLARAGRPGPDTRSSARPIGSVPPSRPSTAPGNSRCRARCADPARSRRPAPPPAPAGRPECSPTARSMPSVRNRSGTSHQPCRCGSGCGDHLAQHLVDLLDQARRQRQLGRAAAAPPGRRARGGTSTGRGSCGPPPASARPGR